MGEGMAIDIVERIRTLSLPPFGAWGRRPAEGGGMRPFAAVRRVVWDAVGHFMDDDGWSMASHLAISALMALFPFLLFAATLASFIGAQAFAETAVHLVFDTWPDQIAAPISTEVERVLIDQRPDFLTLSVILAAYFASNGIEALRTSLNRAYRVVETRHLLWRRTQSLVFVCVATVGILVISVALVVAPLLASYAETRVDWLGQYLGTIADWRILIASVLIISGLVAVHLWLPAGRRRLIHVVPGILFTLVSWLIGSTLFAAYVTYFASYSRTYAGLASIMIAIVFLYIVSVLFILGGELNASIRRYREARARVRG
jgi:membrane protein